MPKYLLKNNIRLWEMLHTHRQLSECLILLTQTTKVLLVKIYPQGGDGRRSQRGQLEKLVLERTRGFLVPDMLGTWGGAGKSRNEACSI